MPHWDPVNLDVPTVADWIAYVADQVISQVTSGTPPPGTFGQFITESDTGRVKGHNGTGFVGFGGLTASAFTAHTPQIDQGATTNIAKTVTYSQTLRYGTMMWWGFTLSLAGTGTAGSQFTLTTPVTMATSNFGAGVGRAYDSSGANAYVGLFRSISTTQVSLFVDANSSAAWGQNPNLALGSADSLYGNLWLPVA